MTIDRQRHAREWGAVESECSAGQGGLAWPRHQRLHRFPRRRGCAHLPAGLCIGYPGRVGRVRGLSGGRGGEGERRDVDRCTVRILEAADPQHVGTVEVERIIRTHEHELPVGGADHADANDAGWPGQGERARIELARRKWTREAQRDHRIHRDTARAVGWRQGGDVCRLRGNDLAVDVTRYDPPGRRVEEVDVEGVAAGTADQHRAVGLQLREWLPAANRAWHERDRARLDVPHLQRHVCRSTIAAHHQHAAIAQQRRCMTTARSDRGERRVAEALEHRVENLDSLDRSPVRIDAAHDQHRSVCQNGRGLPLTRYAHHRAHAEHLTRIRTLE